MTTGYLGKQTNEFHDVVGSKAQREREEMWGPMPGEIVSVDYENQTATIQPLYKPIHDGQPVTMPQLYEVPLDFPRTKSGGAVTSGKLEGSRVMLYPMMRSMENYDTEEDGTPSDKRSFSLADMRATISGGDSVSKPLPNYDPENTHVRFDPEGNFGLKGTPEGQFELKGSQGNIYELINDAIEQTKEGFGYLKTEPALIHTGQYGAIEAALEVILGKLRSMQL